MNETTLIPQVRQLWGEVVIPGSKSHMIRALLIAALARTKTGEPGESVLLSPLVSQDTLSARSLIEQLGARVTEECVSESVRLWRVRAIPAQKFGERLGLDGHSQLINIDIGNSGTSLYLGTAVAALFCRPVRFDGDASIRKRSAANLLQALQNLGVRVELLEPPSQELGRGAQKEAQEDAKEEAQEKAKEASFCCPYTVCGPILGGVTHLSAPTSQYLSALLLALPLAAEGCESEIYLDLLNEHPYVDMTLEWLRGQGIEWYSEGYDRYRICGGQHYQPFESEIPADFSSATFFLCAAAITGSRIRLRGLDPADTQGDKQVLDFLKRMGCDYHWHEERLEDGAGGKGLLRHVLEFCGPAELQAVELDLAQTPDALPALAVTCACAVGVSRIYNVAHARKKETDRIACMATELGALGFAVRENPDGIVISGGRANFLETSRRRMAQGYADHRIIMALSLLNLLQPRDPLVLDDTSYAAVTFPSFFEDLERLQGHCS